MSYDVAIIGAGISGLGVAYNLKDIGLSVALIDPKNPGSETSDNSLRIIHGGLRYFQSLDFLRVIESVKAQAEIAETFPDCVRKLDCYLPLKAFGPRSKLPMYCVGKVYQIFYKILTNSFINTGIKSRADIKERIIDYTNTNSYFQWNDYLLLSHEKLVNKVLSIISPYTKIINNSVIKITKNKLVLSSNEEIEAKVIIDCTNILTKKENIFLWQAINIVVNKEYTTLAAVAVPTKQRMLFFTPRGEYTAIGTFYFPIHITREQMIEESLIEINNSIKIDIKSSDIISIDHGYLPNKFQHKLGLYGNNEVSVKDNVITLLNTKYTTFLTSGMKVKKIVLDLLVKN